MKWDNQVARRGVGRVEVERAILARIAAGNPAPGGRLPTCAQLAAELGSSKNTVSKAFQSLAERGYLSCDRGRGTFVTKRPRESEAELVEHLEGLLLLALQEAKLAGLDQDRFIDLVQSTTARYYRRPQLRIGLIECIPHDATALSRDLQVTLGYPVTPLLLDAVVANPAALDAFDLVGVAVTHLRAVEDALDGHGPELVELFVAPDPAGLAQVIRLRPKTRVGIVCDAQETLDLLLRIVAAYKPDAVVEGCLVSDGRRARRLLSTAEVVLVTISARPSLEELEVHVPLIPVSFQLEPASVQRMSARLDQKLAPQAFQLVR